MSQMFLLKKRKMNTGREEFIDLSFNTSLREFLLIKEFQGILLSDLEK